MRKPLFYFFLGSFFFLLFIFFSYLVHEDLFTQLDFNLTVRLQDNMPRRFDSFFSFFSVAGNFEVLLIVLVGLLILLRRAVAGFITFASFGMFHVIELFGKLYVAHPPPPEFMLRTDHPFSLPQFHVRSEYSYPSGHSGRTIFLSVVLLFIIWKSSLPKVVKVLFIGSIVLINLIMLVSRVYLGEHWTTDVVGGVLLALGFALASLSLYVLPKRFKVLSR